MSTNRKVLIAVAWLAITLAAVAGSLYMPGRARLAAQTRAVHKVREAARLDAERAAKAEVAARRQAEIEQTRHERCLRVYTNKAMCD